MKIVEAVIISAFILTACKKNKAEETNPIPSGHYFDNGCPKPALKLTDPKMLLCKFKPGSYWIYEDSISKAIDTLYVDSLSRRSGHMPYLPLGPCDSAEVYDLKMVFKLEKEDPIKNFHYRVYQYGVLYVTNCPWWEASGDSQGSSIFYITNPSRSKNFKMRDSVFIYDRYYKKVLESDEYRVKASRDKNETLMFHYTIKNYFNPEFGPLQFDYHDFLSHGLKCRYKLIASNIIR